MTSEERFAAHEQWLLDHDRLFADQARKHDETIAEIHAILLELAQALTRLADLSKIKPE